MLARRNIIIGIAYGVAYYLVNRPLSERERATSGPHLRNECPSLERLGAYLGLLFGLGLSVKNGLKGWANLYLGKEDYWNGVFWRIIGPLLIVGTVILIARIRWWLQPSVVFIK
ncbi:MAG TPA: hypothetical protein VGR78_15715 [Verrucomicrobiae bacterium]|nr:hypothetical protein [Verrucomicrobiae bacterium]